jgi:hypothetical protein
VIRKNVKSWQEMVGMKKSRKIRRIHGPNGTDPVITIWQIWAENVFCQAVGWMLSGGKGDLRASPLLMLKCIAKSIFIGWLFWGAA